MSEWKELKLQFEVIGVYILLNSIIKQGSRASYTAAVVEFSPTRTASSPQALIEANLVRYEAFVQQAGEQVR